MSTSDNVSRQLYTTHPDFSQPENVVIHSVDNVRFNIARRDLERTSGWFRNFFNLANRTISGDGDEDIIVIEDAATLQIVLKVALGQEVAPDTISTVSACELALSVAMKYEMSGVTQALKGMLECLLWRNKDAWEQFILACRFGFHALKKDALERCIDDELDYDKLSKLEKDDMLSFLRERDSRIQESLRITRVRQIDNYWSVNNNPFRA